MNPHCCLLCTGCPGQDHIPHTRKPGQLWAVAHGHVVSGLEEMGLSSAFYPLPPASLLLGHGMPNAQTVLNSSLSMSCHHRVTSHQTRLRISYFGGRPAVSSLTHSPGSYFLPHKTIRVGGWGDVLVSPLPQTCCVTLGCSSALSGPQ